MREYAVPVLILLCLPASLAQTVPPGWSLLKDSKDLCQIAVPPDWTPLTGSKGAAVFHDTATAIAVVTSQAGQAFKPLPVSLLKVLDIRKESIFENTARRVYYQERISRNAEYPNSYSASVPGRSGTCSCHVTFLPSVSVEIVRKIVLSLSAVPE